MREGARLWALVALVLCFAVFSARAFTPAACPRNAAAVTSQRNFKLAVTPGSASGGGSDEVDELERIPDVKNVDWRAFRAHMVARSAQEGFGAPHKKWASGRWAHDIGVVEKGCVLLAHESLQGVFYQTAVLILDHDDMHGTLGLILNRPTKKRIAGVPGLGREVQRAFGDCTVLYGGPVGAGGMTALHAVSDAKGCQEVAPHVYVGGLEGLVQLAQQGRVEGSALRLAHGHAAWGPGQLKRELQANFWHLAAVAPELVTGPPASTKATSMLWHQILELMGGEWADVARRNTQQ